MVREDVALWICEANITLGSRGPAVLDDFTSSYGYKFSDPAGYQVSRQNIVYIPYIKMLMLRSGVELKMKQTSCDQSAYGALAVTSLACLYESVVDLNTFATIR